MSATKQAASHGYLRIYLNDHLAGAAGGTELAKRIRKNNAGSPLGQFFDGLVAELEEDEATLRSVMATLGTPVAQPKRIVAVLAERLGRLKLNGRLRGYSALSRLEELELLSVGIMGKAKLWTALRDAAAGWSQLGRFNFDELAARADEQHRNVEAYRLDAARTALGNRSEVADEFQDHGSQE